MRKFPTLPLLFVIFTIVTVACGPITNSINQPSPTQPQSTSEPTKPPTSIPTSVASPTSSPATGSITGKLAYPSEFIPALRVVAFLYGTDTFFTVDTESNQATYKMDGLPEGDYHIVAYTKASSSIPEGLSGGYTKAAACGMGAACTDHTLIDVKVVAGQVVANVDLIDWLVPLPPEPQPGQPVQGAITGELSYPSEFIPPMRVVAFRVTGSQTFYIDTQMNAGTYVLPVPAGTYHVVTYVGGADASAASTPAGYSQAVPCGLSVDCTDHSLIDVVVVQGSVTSGINPGDFYAPEGAFPPAP